MTTRLTNLPVPYTFQFLITSSGTPEQLTVKRRAATIAFNENTEAADTITDSASGFLVAGFQAGDQITVSGSVSNDGTYTVASVTAGTITLLGRNDLTTEASGATVKLIAPKTVPDGVAVTIKAMYSNTGTIRIADSSEKSLNTTTGGFGLRNNESLGIQVDNIDRVWLDATISGEGVEVIFEKSLQA